MKSWAFKSQDTVLYKGILVVLLCSFYLQDLHFQEIVGTIGRSPNCIVAPFILFLLGVLSFFKLTLTKLGKLFLGYSILTLATGFLILGWYTFSTGNTDAYETNLLGKVLKAGYYNIVFSVSYISLVNILMRIEKGFLFKVLGVLFVALSGIGVIELINPTLLNYFHAFDTPDITRLRLVMPESSQAFVFYTVPFLLLAFKSIEFRRSGLLLLLLLSIGYVAISVFILSKGGFLVLLLTSLFTVCILFYSKRINGSLLVFVGAFMFVIINIIASTVIPLLIKDLEVFSSFSTRLITIVSAGISLFNYPFGEGYGTYLAFYPEILSRAIDLVMNYSQTSLNLVELSSMINSGKYLAVKSGILNEVVYNGVIAIYFFIALFRSTYSLIEEAPHSPGGKLILKYTVIYLFLTVFLVSDLITLYCFVIPIAFIEAQALKKMGGGRTAHV